MTKHYYEGNLSGGVYLEGEVRQPMRSGRRAQESPVALSGLLLRNFKFSYHNGYISLYI